jgi:hypothetical protein
MRNGLAFKPLKQFPNLFQHYMPISYPVMQKFSGGQKHIILPGQWGEWGQEPHNPFKMLFD